MVMFVNRRVRSVAKQIPTTEKGLNSTQTSIPYGWRDLWINKV